MIHGDCFLFFFEGSFWVMEVFKCDLEFLGKSMEESLKSLDLLHYSADRPFQDGYPGFQHLESRSSFLTELGLGSLLSKVYEDVQEVDVVAKEASNEMALPLARQVWDMQERVICQLEVLYRIIKDRIDVILDHPTYKQDLRELSDQIQPLRLPDKSVERLKNKALEIFHESLNSKQLWTEILEAESSCTDFDRRCIGIMAPYYKTKIRIEQDSQMAVWAVLVERV